MRRTGSTSKFSVKWLLVAASVAAAIYYVPGLLRGGKADDAPAGGMMGMGGPAPVSVAKVITKPVTEWKEFSGKFEAVNSVQVRPRVGGHIIGIHFEDGAEVKKGQLLFTIDARPYEAAMISAKGALAEAQSVLARAKKLIGSKAISRAEYEAAQRAHDQALGNFKSAEVNLAYTRITAPITGKISRAEITVGNLVDPAVGQLLASIVDLSPIYASFDMDEQSFVTSIQGKGAAKLKDIPIEVVLGNAKGEAIAARIHSFDNQIAPGSGTIRVRAKLENKDQTIVPGLYARVRVGADGESDAVMIHPTAVGTDLDKKFVMVVDENSKAQYRPVVLGQMVGSLQVIKDGLKPDETIVVSGLQRVRPDAPVSGTEVNIETLQPLNPPPAAEDAAASAEEPKAEPAK